MIILIDDNSKKTLLSNLNDESDYILGTKWWRTMVNGGEWWWMEVNGGERWGMVVSDEERLWKLVDEKGQ